MARYDYRCTACGTVFEVSHGMRENPQVACPDCGACATRQFSTSGIVLKGSGFYNTDQRGKTGGTEATGTGKPAPQAKAAEGGSDTAPSTQAAPQAAEQAATASA